MTIVTSCTTVGLEKSFGLVPMHVTCIPMDEGECISFCGVPLGCVFQLVGGGKKEIISCRALRCTPLTL